MTDQLFPQAFSPDLKDDFVRDGYIFDVYDGDTVYYHADLGYDVWAVYLTGRLLDINAPEIRPLVSRVEGLRSKLALQNMLEHYALNRHLDQKPWGNLFRIRSVPTDNQWLPDDRVMKKGKFGRWLIEIEGADESGNSINLNQLMVANGFADPYSD